MNTAKWMKPAALALALSLALGACSGNSGKNGNQNRPAAAQLPVLTDSPYQLTATEEGAADFSALNSSYQSPFANDTCWNITPGFVSENSDFRVFKYGSSNETFVLYDGSAYAVGSGLGGDGVTSMALADVTGDGVYDLCYAYSEDADSRVGYFDPAQKTANELPGSFHGQAIVLRADGNTLQVCGATVTGYESLLSMTLEPGSELAQVILENGTVTLEKTASPEEDKPAPQV